MRLVWLVQGRAPPVARSAYLLTQRFYVVIGHFRCTVPPLGRPTAASNSNTIRGPLPHLSMVSPDDSPPPSRLHRDDPNTPSVASNRVDNTASSLQLRRFHIASPTANEMLVFDREAPACGHDIRMYIATRSASPLRTAVTPTRSTATTLAT